MEDDRQFVCFLVGEYEIRFDTEEVVHLMWRMIPDIVTNENATGLDRLKRVAIKNAIRAIADSSGIQATLPRGMDYLVALFGSMITQVVDELSKNKWVLHGEAYRDESERIVFEADRLTAATEGKSKHEGSIHTATNTSRRSVTDSAYNREQDTYLYGG